MISEEELKEVIERQKIWTELYKLCILLGIEGKKQYSEQIRKILEKLDPY